MASPHPSTLSPASPVERGVDAASSASPSAASSAPGPAAASRHADPTAAHAGAARRRRRTLPGQVVLVLQGGGALGAYQVGVYHALHDAGIEPDWVIGTSIGAINGAIIAGNPPEARMERLDRFWDSVTLQPALQLQDPSGTAQTLANLSTVTFGIPAFFAPNPAAWWGARMPVGVEHAAYYSTEPLRRTIEELVDFEYLQHCRHRLTVGAVNVERGEMRYFDTRRQALTSAHVMASGALPPAFPAVRLEDGEAYWDGGVYSNTPLEAVLQDDPRHDSVIFSVQMWQQRGPEPASIWEAMGRMKDIQYASRDTSEIERHKQMHRLRHVIRELSRQLTPEQRRDPALAGLGAWGCGTRMHVLKLDAPTLNGEDQTKDIDFTGCGIARRRQAGYDDTCRAIAAEPWTQAVDPIEGVLVHEFDEAAEGMKTR